MNGSESAINRCGRRGIPCARIGHLPASIETATAEIKSRLLMIGSVCHRSRGHISSGIPPFLGKGQRVDYGVDSESASRVR